MVECKICKRTFINREDDFVHVSSNNKIITACTTYRFPFQDVILRYFVFIVLNFNTLIAKILVAHMNFGAIKVQLNT